MVMEHSHHGHHTNHIVIPTIIGIFFIIVGAIFFLTVRPEQEKRSIIIRTNPLTIVTWEVATDPQYTILVIPTSVQIDATHGMGWYGVDALWKLDSMDGRHGELFTSSIEDACGFPMKWFLQPSGDISVGTSKEQIVQTAINATSLSSLLSSVFGKQTNMNILDAVRTWRRLQDLAPDTATVVDFRTTTMTSDVTLPDGSTVQQFDPMRYDALIGDALEDALIRSDALHIMLYNTTQTPGIAQELARTIDHMGGFVVAVANDTPEVSGSCELRGSEKVLHTQTARMIQQNYQCTSKEGDTQRADLEIRLGNGFVKRYLPF